MAEAAATQTYIEQEPYLHFSSESPQVIAIPEMTSDEFTRRRAARFIGAVVTGAALENLKMPEIQQPIESLYEGIQRAARGDRIALNMVETNVRTDVIERTIKKGHVMTPVELTVNDDGKLLQYQQAMDTVQANSLRFAADHPIMRARTEAETRNSFRLENLNREGLLDEYSFVVLSRADNLKDYFYTETMSCSIQVTSKHGDVLQMETAFVAGIATQDEAAHDKQTIIKLGERLGVDFTEKTPAEIIDTPLLIHNSLLTNGVVDLVRMYDEVAGGTFFGEAKPQQDYLEYLQKCRDREHGFSPKIQKITDALLAEAATICSPIEAVQRLNKLSGQHMVELAIQDTSIDISVFGPVAAPHIEAARMYHEQGNMAMAVREMNVAKKTETSFSCPSAMKSAAAAETGMSDNPGESSAENSDSGEEDQYGSLTFKCPKGHTNKRPRGKLIPRCQSKGCTAKVTC